MGKPFSRGAWKESLRVRRMIQHHFDMNGASRVRNLPPEQFCGHGFVLAKASEAGFGNEMYKLLNAVALSILLNRSLIIGQTRHIGVDEFGFLVFDDFRYSAHTLPEYQQVAVDKIFSYRNSMGHPILQDTS
ncbi:hypothetical protein HS088_TW15G01358 [Tripterygium wilfordii]|uniref:Uncharacterized protein n=1 Tax=Tripterygium wilfordii TaxID=458696 RepID=A0A7J7CP26_TRIWF|nr:hypothetical protein HS088_TW15G01358 [Tripterygium wilfordii]